MLSWLKNYCYSFDPQLSQGISEIIGGRFAPPSLQDPLSEFTTGYKCFDRYLQFQDDLIFRNLFLFVFSYKVVISSFYYFVITGSLIPLYTMVCRMVLSILVGIDI
jgi:hypothetical protein